MGPGSPNAGGNPVSQCSIAPQGLPRRSGTAPPSQADESFYAAGRCSLATLRTAQSQRGRGRADELIVASGLRPTGVSALFRDPAGETVAGRPVGDYQLGYFLSLRRSESILGEKELAGRPVYGEAPAMGFRLHSSAFGNSPFGTGEGRHAARRLDGPRPNHWSAGWEMQPGATRRTVFFPGQ